MEEDNGPIKNSRKGGEINRLSKITYPFLEVCP
jgi:hypothetical protein